MIMHVAEAGEQRGRVVLHVTSSRPSAIAIEAAVRIAQAFHSEIESLFVEDMQLYDMARFPFAREISLTGAKSRALSSERMEQELRLAARAVHRQVRLLAKAANVPVRARQVRDDPMLALAKACAEDGPWNVVALGDAVMPGHGQRLRELFEGITDTTGLVLVGPRACRAFGPIVTVVESARHLQPLLKVGERLSALGASNHTLLLLAEEAPDLMLLEQQVRLAIGGNAGIAIVTCEGRALAPAAIAEVLRRLGAGFVIGHYGGLLVPAGAEIRELASAMECPLFLMR